MHPTFLASVAIIRKKWLVLGPRFRGKHRTPPIAANVTQIIIGHRALCSKAHTVNTKLSAVVQSQQNYLLKNGDEYSHGLLKVVLNQLFQIRRICISALITSKKKLCTFLEKKKWCAFLEKEIVFAFLLRIVHFTKTPTRSLRSNFRPSIQPHPVHALPKRVPFALYFCTCIHFNTHVNQLIVSKTVQISSRLPLFFQVDIDRVPYIFQVEALFMFFHHISYHFNHLFHSLYKYRLIVTEGWNSAQPRQHV